MLRIALIDDEPAVIELIKSYLNEWAVAKSIYIKIDEYHGGEAFFFAYGHELIPDILILDIQMPGMNGVEIAKQIRKTDKNMPILFITGHVDFMSQGYDVSAVHYLIKPVCKNKLNVCMDRAAGMIYDKGTPIVLKSGDGLLRLVQEDIYSIEAFGHSVMIKTAVGEFKTVMGLNELVNLIDDSLFIRSHRSYIAGLKHIMSITRQNIIMDDNSIVPVSRRRYNTVNERFLEFHRRNG